MKLVSNNGMYSAFAAHLRHVSLIKISMWAGMYLNFMFKLVLIEDILALQIQTVSVLTKFDAHLTLCYLSQSFASVMML